MDSSITSLKPGRTLSMTHERHGRACDGRDLSVKFNLAQKVKSDPRAGGIGRGGGALCVEMGFYADISWEARCNIEINFCPHFYKILLVFEVPYQL